MVTEPLTSKNMHWSWFRSSATEPTLSPAAGVPEHPTPSASSATASPGMVLLNDAVQFLSSDLMSHSSFVHTAQFRHGGRTRTSAWRDRHGHMRPSRPPSPADGPMPRVINDRLQIRANEVEWSSDD